MTTKPSERFCKHGFLTEGEKYNPELHNYGGTVEERCEDYYSPEEIERMKGEIKVAECAICMENLTDKNNCITCSDGHKFHNTCLTDYWTRNPGKQNNCPTTNSIPSKGWERCYGINDINSGGRRRKTINKKRKTYKKNKKSNKKNKKTNKKNKKSYKKRT
jgi:hypothetical protein